MTRAKPDQSVRWSKRERALLYHFERDKPTSMLIAWFLEEIRMGNAYGRSPCDPPRESDERTLAQELEARGYDLATLRFSIRKKQTPTP